MTILESKVLSGFASELADYLFKQRSGAVVRLPGKELRIGAMARPELEALARIAIRRAANYGLRWRSALASFAVTMFVVAPNFDQDGRVREVLNDPDIDPNFRMDAVRRHITEDQWKAIQDSYDVKAWSRRP